MSLLLLFHGAPPVASQPSNKSAISAALIAAYATVTLDNGFIGGRAPYEPRHLPPQVTAVPVDNPTPRRSPSMEAIVYNWPREAAPLPELPPKIIQGVVDFKLRRSAAIETIIASWPAVPDPLPQTTRKLVQEQPVNDPNPRRSASLEAIIATWPHGFDPLPQPPPRKVVQGVRVDNPTPRRQPGIEAIVYSWPGVGPLPQPPPRKIVQGVQVDNPPPRYPPALEHIQWRWEADPLPQWTRKLSPDTVAPPQVDNPPIGRWIDRILKQAGDWTYETRFVDIGPPKLVQGLRVDHVARRPPLPPGAVESWQIRPEYQDIRKGAIPSVKVPFSRRWLETVKASWDAPPEYPQRARRSIPPDVVRVPFTRGWFAVVRASWEARGEIQQARPGYVPAPPVVSAYVPYTRRWLATVQVSWDVPDVRSQRAPFLVPPSVVPPVVLPDCGHLLPSIVVSGDLVSAISHAGAISGTSVTSGTARVTISRTGRVRTSLSIGAKLKSEIRCR